MRKRLVGVVFLSVLAASCRYLPFWTGEKDSDVLNPDLILLIGPDSTPYPQTTQDIVPVWRQDENMLYYVKGEVLAAEQLCGNALWAKPLPDGDSFEILRFDTLIDSFPDNCVNFYDLWFSDTESLLVFTTGVPYVPPPPDTTQYPYHKLFLYDLITGNLDTLDWGCPSYIDPRFSASGRYIFVATGGNEWRPSCRGTLWRIDRQTDAVDSVLVFEGGPRYGGWSIYTGYVVEGDSVWIVQGDPVDMNVLPDVDPWEGRFVVMQKYYGPSKVAPGGLVVWDRVEGILYTLDIPWPSPWDFRPFTEYYPQWVEISGLGQGILLVLFFEPDGEGGRYASKGIWFVKHWRQYISQQEVVP